MMWLKRFRHTRGFGVHSPFAFRFITECLGERWPYYAYAGFTGFEQCLALRLAVFFQPRRVQALSSDVSRLAKAAQKGCSHPMLAESPAIQGLGVDCRAMLIAGPDFGQTDAALKDIEGKILWVVANQGAVGKMQAQLDSLGYGMSFIDRDTAIFAIFPNLTRQTFYPRIS